jgi:hypothetical protein
VHTRQRQQTAIPQETRKKTRKWSSKQNVRSISGKALAGWAVTHAGCNTGLGHY